MSGTSMEHAILETLRVRCKKELDIDLELWTCGYNYLTPRKLCGVVGYYIIDVWFTGVTIKLRATVPLLNRKHLGFDTKFSIYDPYSMDEFIKLMQKYKIEPTAELMPHAIKPNWP